MLMFTVLSAKRKPLRDFGIATSLFDTTTSNSNFKMATSQPQWLLYAISSGVCASLNGVFAKMTTTTEFEKWSFFFGMKEESLIVEALVRGVCAQLQSPAVYIIQCSISD